MKNTPAALLLAALIAPGVHADEQLLLTPRAGTGCPVLVQDGASDAERYAAEELARYLGQMTGAAFPVTNAATGGPAIALAYAPGLGMESYRLRVDPSAGRLLIEGGRPRGVLYGVYALLEDHLGCRWYTREVARIPKRGVVGVPAALDERVTPRFEYREVFWTEAFDGDWAARNRLNSKTARLGAKHGGRVEYGPFVHTFENILPVEKHFDTHPEYYSLVNGKRIRTHPQLCLTNPEVLQHAIAAVRRWIAEKPGATIFSVSQNDWYNPCTCAGCKAIDDAEGSHAGTMLTFVNAVAEAVGKDHPDVLIDTLAYQYTRKPPRTVRPRPNVVVRLCSIECCFAHPLDGCPEKSNASFMDDLRGWQKLSNRLYVWDYTTDFAHYLLPFPNLDSLDDNVRTFASHGVAGVFEQGNYSSGGGGELAELRSWVLAKLLWNPALDGDALLREFVAGVYGPAAPAVQRYLDLRRAAIAKAGNHVRIFDGPRRPDLAPEFVRGWDAELEGAQQLAGGDTALQARIRRLWMPVWYTQTAQAREPVEILRRAATCLADAARAEKITNFREWSRGIEADLKPLEIMRHRKPRACDPGATCIEDHQFSLHREGDLTELVADDAAEDGVAARLVGRTLEWAVQWKPSADTELPAGRYRVRARIRVEKTGDAGAAFHGGLYDTGTKKGIGGLTVQAAAVADGGYHLYDLGECDLKPGLYAYLAPNDNEANIKALFIDRLEIVPAQQPR